MDERNHLGDYLNKCIFINIYGCSSHIKTRLTDIFVTTKQIVYDGCAPVVVVLDILQN